MLKMHTFKIHFINDTVAHPPLVDLSVVNPFFQSAIRHKSRKQAKIL